MEYTAKTFTVPELRGISAKTIEEHLKLYAGYVKHTNLILAKVQELKKELESPSANSGSLTYTLGEINRRFGFEYNGMRNHEVYFSLLEGGSTELTAGGPLHQTIEKQWGSFDAWMAEFKAIALTRGIGWAILYYDRAANRLLNAWIDEQHLGQLQDCTVLVALDMWEHSYVADYQPSGKKSYVDDYLSQINWKKVEENFK